MLTDLTCETPAPGLQVWQPRRGHRFGVEVYALAAFALGESGGGPIPRPESAIDLGCGSGIVGLLLAWRGVRVIGVERQPEWVGVARRNCKQNGVAMTVVEADLRSWHAEADVVVSNPPWFPMDQPRSPDPVKAASRSMLHGDVTAFVDAGLRCASRVCVVTRREREGEVDAPVARRAALGEELVLLEYARTVVKRIDEPLDLPACYAAFGR